jgi:hypothetical protein
VVISGGLEERMPTMAKDASDSPTATDRSEGFGERLLGP